MMCPLRRRLKRNARSAFPQERTKQHSKLLDDIKSNVRRLQGAGWGLRKISRVLFNRSPTYASKIRHGHILPSPDALRQYEEWAALIEGSLTEVSRDLCEVVWYYLGTGKENSRTASEIGASLLVHPSKIRRAGQRLVFMGYSVGTWGGGMYRIATKGEKDENIRKLIDRERAIRSRRIALSKANIPVLIDE